MSWTKPFIAYGWHLTTKNSKIKINTKKISSCWFLHVAFRQHYALTDIMQWRDKPYNDFVMRTFQNNANDYNHYQILQTLDLIHIMSGSISTVFCYCSFTIQSSSKFSVWKDRENPFRYMLVLSFLSLKTRERVNLWFFKSDRSDREIERTTKQGNFSINYILWHHTKPPL